MWHVYKGWKPVFAKLEKVLKEEDRTPPLLQIIRIIAGLIINSVLIIWGCIVDPNIYNWILIACLVNMSCYFLNYIATKRFICGEKGTVLAWAALLISFMLWIPALVAFFIHSTNSEASPSTSRGMNSPCDFLVYDTHDMWHVLSALALFFFFVGLLTLDDDLCSVRSERIPVF